MLKSSLFKYITLAVCSTGNEIWVPAEGCREGDSKGAQTSRKTRRCFRSGWHGVEKVQEYIVFQKEISTPCTRLSSEPETGKKR